MQGSILCFSTVFLLPFCVDQIPGSDLSDQQLIVLPVCRGPANQIYDIYFQGQLYVNGFNLGRYWPDAGPQETLYVPAPFLSAGQKRSTVVLLELDDAPCDSSLTCFIESVSVPILNGTVHPLNPRLTQQMDPPLSA